MIDRLEWLERRLAALEQAVAWAEASAAQARQAAWQSQGNLGSLGAGRALVWGRAVGAIGGRVGTTLGSGTVHLARAAGGTLAEGTESRAAKNLVTRGIVDDAWVLMGYDEDDQLVILAVGDPCNDLVAP